MTANQIRAAKPEASVWVSASAGTGKTKVLTDRVLNLLLAGTAPERILCLTFTKAAAAEMSQRIARTLGTWATMDDVALKKDLNRLSTQVPEPETMRAARRLFAAVLDVPGGMKIMTIHAFCQSLLKRFPLEAGLAPHFVVMDERDAAELMDEARKELLVRVQREGGDLAAALDRVTRHAGEERFNDVMREMSRERARLRRLLAGGDAVETALWKRLGLGPDDTYDAIAAAACADVAFDAMGLRLAAGAMVQGSKTDQAHGQIVADWLAAAPVERADHLAGYLSAYFTDGGKGDRRAHLVHKDAAALDPHAETVLAAEAERLAQIRERLRAATIFAATTAVLRLGAAWLDIYERHKADRALLDYDDLILLSRDLLTGDGAAAWVLYKLDGGIDHILIDEAQDTNPEQWEIVRALAEEFFAGEGAHETRRTIFAVGDPKQSIYSFQRAAPEEFERMREFFSARVRACAARWDDVPLEDSFRSTAAILKLVDAVFTRAPARDGVVTGDRPLRHLVHRAGQAGRVELWPLAPLGEKQETDDWAPPVEQIPAQSPRARLAAFIAARIQGWIETGERLASADRPIRAGDIIVLLPRRSAFVEELVWALKQRGVPVAGVDRMVLTEQLPVMDLMALGRFLLMPEDDLTLATVLKSPICGLSEDQLFCLAHGRAASLWQALMQQRGEAPEFERVADELGALLAKADFVPPYELYADLLGAGGGRRRLLARLGHEADDPIDEFLSLCLAYERVHTPSLQGFLHWFEAGQTAIKRDLEQASRDEVRVMTVHGAKGLEAPIVFLPDTMQTPSRLTGSRSALLWPEGDGILLWPPKKEHEEAVATAARAEALERQYREHRRLLYVALTRAAERLYVCGWAGQQKVPEDCWYNLVAGAMDEIAEPVEDILADRPLGWPGQGWRLDVAQTVPVEPPEVLGAPAETAPPPDWLDAPAPLEPSPPRPLAPSRPSASEPSVRSPVQGADGRPDDGVRFRRGLLIHRLLQVLPETPSDGWAELCDRYLAMADRALGESARQEIAQEVLAVLDDPRMQPFYGPDTRAEVPLSGVIADQVVSGQVDRLLVTADAVHVLDYKSNRPPPDREQDVSPAYLKQMAAYRALLRGIYPDRPVSCALLWTDGPRLMPLSDAILDSHVP